MAETEQPASDQIQQTCGIVINFPVEWQLRTAISMIASFVSRQDLVRAAQAGKVSVRDVPGRAVDSDADADTQIADRLRYGWRSAAETLAQTAAERGWRLRCSYHAPFIDDLASLRRRIPGLRRAYNSVGPVRNLIDQAVAAAHSDSVRVVNALGPEKVRAFLQRTQTTWRLRKHVNHAFRDALVCGNGFIVLDLMGEFPIRNLNPEHVEAIDATGITVADENGRSFLRTNSFIHLPGTTQVQASFGVSTLEPAMHSVAMIWQASEMKEKLSQALAGATPQTALTEGQRVELEGMLSIQDGMATTAAEALDALLHGVHLEEGVEDLYFDGYESL